MNPAERHTIILDMDGTLLDLNFDDQVWNYALPDALARRNGCTREVARARITDTLGSARGTLPWYCLDHWEREFGVSVHALEVELAHFIGVRGGTCDFLDFLREQSYRTLLATNAHPASLARKMARTGLQPYFAALVSSHELDAPKEDLAFWRRLVGKCDIDPAGAVLVDDNPAVLSTAREFGIRHVFGVRTPSSTGDVKYFGHFASVDSLAELIPWLQTGAALDPQAS